MSQTLRTTIRRASPGDAAIVRHLVRAAYAKWIPVIGREPLPMQADYQAAIQNNRVDLLCCDDDLLGLIEMIPKSDHLLIENIAVAPEFWGRGHGRALLTHAETVAASLGTSEIRLYTNQLFAGNVKLYRKFGYRVDREDPFKDGFVVHMSKNLA